MDNPEPPPRHKRGKRQSFTKEVRENVDTTQLPEAATGRLIPEETIEVPPRTRRLSRRASNPLALLSNAALSIKSDPVERPAGRQSHPVGNSSAKVEKHVKFVPETKTETAKRSNGKDKNCEHRRSLSVPASVRGLRRPLNLSQLVHHPHLVVSSSSGSSGQHSNYLQPPPPIESLLCSSAAPLSLPYWLQPPGCRTANVSKSQNRTVFHQTKLPNPAKMQGSSRQLRPVIKTPVVMSSGGSLSSGSGPDSGSDSEVSQPKSSPPSAPRKVVTFNYLTQVQLVDI